jgi:predicted esterase
MRREILLGMGLVAAIGLAGLVSAAPAPKAASPTDTAKTLAAPAVPTGPVPTLDLKPGENRVEPPGGRPYLIWVPTDYTPDRTWPLIIYMHGTGGAPTFGPLREMFGGKTFILVGHEYVFHNQAEENHATETANLRRVVATVQANLKVNPKQMFLGGFSQGGWWTTMLAEYTMDLWAGLFPLGSGEHASDMGRRGPLKGKPIFIGAGENDGQFLPLAKKSAEFYAGRGADVTTEWFAGLGHSDNVAKNEKLQSWFLKLAPQKPAPAAGKASPPAAATPAPAAPPADSAKSPQP